MIVNYANLTRPAGSAWHRFIDRITSHGRGGARPSPRPRPRPCTDASTDAGEAASRLIAGGCCCDIRATLAQLSLQLL